MNSTDKYGLSLSQIRRIDRLKMSRHRKQQGERLSSFVSYIPLILLLLSIAVIMVFVTAVAVNRWNPGTELYTRLPADLDQQAPSITIYGN